MLAVLHSLGTGKLPIRIWRKLPGKQPTISLATRQGLIVDLFKSPCRLEAENLFLRHQLSIALRRAPPRVRLRGCDRALWPSLLGAAQVVFWRWKSRKRAGRPKIDREMTPMPATGDPPPCT
jgi:hypothetical protein